MKKKHSIHIMRTRRKTYRSRRKILRKVGSRQGPKKRRIRSRRRSLMGAGTPYRKAVNDTEEATAAEDSLLPPDPSGFNLIAIMGLPPGYARAVEECSCCMPRGAHDASSPFNLQMNIPCTATMSDGTTKNVTLVFHPPQNLGVRYADTSSPKVIGYRTNVGVCLGWSDDDDDGRGDPGGGYQSRAMYGSYNKRARDCILFESSFFSDLPTTRTGERRLSGYMVSRKYDYSSLNIAWSDTTSRISISVAKRTTKSELYLKLELYNGGRSQNSVPDKFILKVALEKYPLVLRYTDNPEENKQNWKRGLENLIREISEGRYAETQQLFDKHLLLKTTLTNTRRICMEREETCRLCALGNHTPQVTYDEQQKVSSSYVDTGEVIYIDNGAGAGGGDPVMVFKPGTPAYVKATLRCQCGEVRKVFLIDEERIKGVAEPLTEAKIMELMREIAKGDVESSAEEARIHHGAISTRAVLHFIRAMGDTTGVDPDPELAKKFKSLYAPVRPAESPDVVAGSWLREINAEIIYPTLPQPCIIRNLNSQGEIVGEIKGNTLEGEVNANLPWCHGFFDIRLNQEGVSELLGNIAKLIDRPPTANPGEITSVVRTWVSTHHYCRMLEKTYLDLQCASTESPEDETLKRKLATYEPTAIQGYCRTQGLPGLCMALQLENEPIQYHTLCEMYDYRAPADAASGAAAESGHPVSQQIAEMNHEYIDAYITDILNGASGVDLREWSKELIGTAGGVKQEIHARAQSIYETIIKLEPDRDKVANITKRARSMGILVDSSTQPKKPQPEYDDLTIQSSATAFVKNLSYTQDYLSLDEILSKLYDADAGPSPSACARLIQLGKDAIQNLRIRKLEATQGKRIEPEPESQV